MTMRTTGFSLEAGRRAAHLLGVTILAFPLAFGAAPDGATGVAEAGGPVDSSTVLRVEGTILVLSGQEAVAGASVSTLLPDRVQLLTPDGAEVDLAGHLVDDAETGSTFVGSVSIPARAVAGINAEIGGPAHSPAKVIEGDSRLGAKVLAASDKIDQPLTVTSASITASITASVTAPVTTDAAMRILPAAHTLSFAIVSLPTSPAEVVLSDADVDRYTKNLSTYWNSQSAGQVARISKSGSVDRFVSASACDADRIWSEATDRLGVSKASWGLSATRHLVVVVPESCGGGSGYGSVGPSITGGLVWVAYSAPVIELTLAHELGHNVSLRHSNAAVCTTAVSEGATCTDFEYHDFYDIMGGGLTINDSGSQQLMALNVTHKYRLDALDSGSLVSVRLTAGVAKKTKSYTLNPASATGGVRGLRVIDPGTGEAYFVEFRSGTGIDSGSIYSTSIFTGHAPGVRVLTLRADLSSAAFTVPSANPDVRNLYLTTGQTFTGRSGRLSISVTGTGATATVKVQLGVPAPASTPTIVRHGGADRFATAVEVSANYAPGVPVVYVASGATFPDALSAGPAAAAEGGPLLLTTQTAVPAPVQAEISRLRPARIVVVGGPASVGQSAFDELAALAPKITRVWGDDRFSTSRAVLASAFGESGAPRVYLAAGSNFPDALSASAAAGSRGGAVLLVNGGADALDAQSTALLRMLDPVDVVLAGGPVVLSRGVEAAAKKLGFAGGAFRLAGAGRFESSRAINAETFADPDVVYLANGYTFPDALAGAALAGFRHSPLYIVPGTCVPQAILADITRYAPAKVVLLGGPVSMTPEVESLTPCEF